MSCFSCFSTNSRKSSKRIEYSPSPAQRREYAPVAPTPKPSSVPNGNYDLNRKPREDTQKPAQEIEPKNEGNGNIAAKTFTFRELASATKNFRPECLIGEGGFGRVYKGQLDNGQLAAVKQLDRNGFQGNREFLVEVLMLSLLHHPNLVNLIGYCADGDQRLLVYEFMPLGSLEDHLLDITDKQKPLSWSIRMKVAYGAAKGLEYLHGKANPPVIYRDLKSSNILLDEEYNPKLSDFGLAKLGPMGEALHVSSRVMGTYGYCAPEYARTGQLTLKSDVYSFGVVLLELITGRRVIDTLKPVHEQNLVTWAQPMFKDQNRYVELADPLFRGKFPVRGLNQAVAVAAMCLQEEASVRPMMTDVVTALSFLLTDPESYSEESSAQPTPIHSHHDSRTSDDCSGVLTGDDVVNERERIVQEAIQWGESNSRQYNTSLEHVQISEMV